MKTLAAIIASVLLSIVTFSLGVFGATLYLSTPEPASLSRAIGVADLWTTEPKVVARNRHQREAAEGEEMSASRIELGSLPNETRDQQSFLDAQPDEFLTSSIAEDQNPGPKTLSREHVQWCISRYNSYRADDDTYQPYTGKRRHCVSPYFANGAPIHDVDRGVAEEVLLSSDRSLGDGQKNAPLVTADVEDHTRKCGERYKSYRTDDNTYQPYDGGPRRQCQ